MLLGTVLIVAALLKAQQWVSEPSAAARLVEQRWQSLAAVQAELALGWLLVTGYCRRVAWWIALCCFTALAGISFSEAAAGETSCGCFGAVAVSPWATLALDGAAVGALLRWRPAEVAAADSRRLERGLAGPSYAVAAPRCVDASSSAKPLSRRRRVSAALAVWLCVAAPVGGVVSQRRFVPLEDLGTAADGETVRVEPARWVGKLFPLAGEIEIDADLSLGRWCVLFHRQGCTLCQRALNRMAARAKADAKGEAAAVGYAVIELGEGHESSVLSPVRGAAYGRLNAAREWLIETPTLALLEDGRVISAVSGAGVLEEQLWRRLQANRRNGHGVENAQHQNTRVGLAWAAPAVFSQY